MPAVVPFIPLIAPVVGAVTSFFSGQQAQQQNNQVRSDQQALALKQQGYFDRVDAQNGTLNNLLFGSGGSNAADIARLENSGDPRDRARATILKAMGAGSSGGPTSLAGILSNYNAGMKEQTGYLEGLKGQFSGLSDKLTGLDGQYGSLGDALSDVFKTVQGQGPQMSDTSAQQSALMASGNRLLSETSRDAYREQARLAGDDAMNQLGADLAARGLGNSGTLGRTGANTLARLYADADVKYNNDRIGAASAANSAFSGAGQLNMGTAQANNSAQQGWAGVLSSMLGQQGNLLGARAGLVNQQSGLLGQQMSLGQLLAGLLGQQAGVQQGIVGAQIAGVQNQQNTALNQAQILGGKEASLNQNINPNPYGGVGAALGAIGTGAQSYMNYQQQQDWYNLQRRLPGLGWTNPGGYGPDPVR